MRILIYGAGVIGCLYAALFAKAGVDTTVYARGRRLEMLREHGLLYATGKLVQNASVQIIDKVAPDDVYDFVFLTVKENQVHTALRELWGNTSPTIVTMVNTLDPYSAWEELCGKGRLLPAFPGAGGSFEGNVLRAALTPWIIQPTTFGEINGIRTERTERLAALLRQAHIPYQIVTDMHAWQICHLAMVVPIADAYYKADVPEKAGEDKHLMRQTAQRMQQNFRQLKQSGVVLSPKKMHLFRLLPEGVLGFGLGLVFRSRFGHTFMYQHSINAPDEMRQLHEQFYGYLKNMHKKYPHLSDAEMEE